LAKGLVLHYKLDGEGFGNTNLVRGNYSAVTTNSSNIISGSVTLDTSLISLAELKGKTLYFSYDYSIEGTKYDTSNDWSKNRYGIHGCLSYVNSSGSSVTEYPFANYLNASGTGRAI
jgi:hypothetical protein